MPVKGHRYIMQHLLLHCELQRTGSRCSIFLKSILQPKIGGWTTYAYVQSISQDRKHRLPSRKVSWHLHTLFMFIGLKDRTWLASTHEVLEGNPAACRSGSIRPSIQHVLCVSAQEYRSSIARPVTRTQADYSGDLCGRRDGALP